MNLKPTIFSILLICTGSTSIHADEYQRGFSSSRTCTRNEYREEYIPGTRRDPGYVKNWEETVEVPCPGVTSTRNPRVNTTTNSPVNSSTNNEKIDNNDCTEGKIAGGILGGGLATAISRGKDRWWAIPAGVIGGSMAGCQIDGG
tara:strand:+ start:177 stop:611 length:435 start_codon:yes stop_codon:yes gene_type:complete